MGDFQSESGSGWVCVYMCVCMCCTCVQGPLEKALVSCQQPDGWFCSVCQSNRSSQLVFLFTDWSASGSCSEAWAEENRKGGNHWKSKCCLLFFLLSHQCLSMFGGKKGNSMGILHWKKEGKCLGWEYRKPQIHDLCLIDPVRSGVNSVHN